MKKILFAAVIALAFVACSDNGQHQYPYKAEVKKDSTAAVKKV